jgi:hypothetical protein
VVWIGQAGGLLLEVEVGCPSFLRFLACPSVGNYASGEAAKRGQLQVVSDTLGSQVHSAALHAMGEISIMAILDAFMNCLELTLLLHLCAYESRLNLPIRIAPCQP